MRLLSFGIRRKARKQAVNYTFVFMRANGAQLQKIATLVEEAIIRPVIDRSFSFASTAEALKYVEQGRAKGKVVVTLK
jgi:NADPH:quinone reductase-like Zn-dependent oxidoreductase